MKNNNGLKFAVIGGDARQLIAASRLCSMGHEIRLFGFGDDSIEHNTVDSLCCSSSAVRPHELIENLPGGSVLDCGVVCSSSEEAIDGCDGVILPLPMSGDGKTVSMPLAAEKKISVEYLAELMAEYGVRFVCGGKITEVFKEYCEERGISVFDYYEQEEFSAANAVPTAEGAIEIAMQELPITLHRASALVIGYGRIGKVLARILRAMGVNVTVSARKNSDLAWIRIEGFGDVETGHLKELFENSSFDVIFNTVPFTVLGEQELKSIPAGTLIIDLASKPGGVDIAAADKRSHNVIWALSLPGKVAPVTSGHIIADTIIGYIQKNIGAGE